MPPRSTNATHTANVEADGFPDPMPEYKADKYLGGHNGLTRSLRMLGILAVPKSQHRKITTCCGEKWSYLNTKADLNKIKKCIDTVKQLRKDSFARPSHDEIAIANLVQDARNPSQVTAFTRAPHPFIAGQKIVIAGVTAAVDDSILAYNGVFQITSVNMAGTTFTYVDPRLTTVVATTPNVGTAVNRSLFVVKATYKNDGKHLYELIDLGAECGQIFMLEEAAKRYGIPLTRLRGAIEKGKIECIWIFPCGNAGGDWIIGLLERHLVKFVNEDKPTKNIDPNKFQPSDGLCNLVGTTTITQKIEVSECARLWAEQGKLETRKVVVEFSGKVPARWHRKQGCRIPVELKATTKHRDSQRYHIKQFLELWNKPLTEHVAKLKRLIAARKSIYEINEELRTDGIIGERLKRVIRLAGVVTELGAYAQKHTHATPVRERRSDGALAIWLKGRIEQNGYVYLPSIRDIAMTELGISESSVGNLLSLAYAQLHERTGGCDKSNNDSRRKDLSFSHHLYEARTGVRGVVRHTFWYMPGQKDKLPGEDELRRIIAEYRSTQSMKATGKSEAVANGVLSPLINTEQDAARSRNSATPVANGVLTPNANSTNGKDDDLTPSRKKQRWCYEQYTDHSKKLSRILEAVKPLDREGFFGKKPPTSEADIYTYAKRWAEFKNLPFSKRI